MTIKLELSGDQEARLFEAQAKVDREAALLVLLEALRPAVARLVGPRAGGPGVEARRRSFRQLTAELTREYQNLDVKPERIASTRDEIYGDRY
jgi:hypothetical protein